MRASFHRFALLFGAAFSGVSLILFLFSVLVQPDIAIAAAVTFSVGIAIANQFQTVRIDEGGISSWRLLRGRTQIVWGDVQEIGIGCAPIPIFSLSKRDLAFVYLSTRVLDDSERNAVNPMDKTRIVFPYVNPVTPRSGSAAKCRQALQNYYPDTLPEGIRVPLPEQSFQPTYVIRK